MELLKHLAILLLFGCTLSEPNNNKDIHQSVDQPSLVDASKQDDQVTDEDKRLYGSVLSSGFKLGKKQSPSTSGITRYDIKQDFKKWYYGTILGKGLMSGKRYYNSGQFGDDMLNDKRELDTIDQDLDAVELEGPVDDKRWFGRAFEQDIPRRRIKRSANDKRFLNYFGRGFVVRPERDSDDVYDVDDATEGEDADDIISDDKRYFWTNPGYRFNFGKREDGFPDASEGEYDGDDDDGFPVNKRFFGNVLGRGYAFGKRRFAHNKRRFGYILGNGFSFGKRTSDDAYDTDSEDLDMNKRAGWLLGRGFKLGKRWGSKRFGWILGRGLKFGKRASPAEPMQGEYFIDDLGHVEDISEQMAAKRFGHVLGSGFAFGKRDVDEADSMPSKRGFGFVLGRGFRLGRR